MFLNRTDGDLSVVVKQFPNRERMMRKRILDCFVSLSLMLGLILASTAIQADNRSTMISARVALAAAAAGDMTIVDVRSPLEWRMTGIPDGSVPITIHHADGAAGFVAEILGAVDGDRTRPIALICASGVRSGAAQALLLAQGFTNIHNLAEGMHGSRAGQGWLAEGLPVGPCSFC